MTAESTGVWCVKGATAAHVGTRKTFLKTFLKFRRAGLIKEVTKPQASLATARNAQTFSSSRLHRVRARTQEAHAAQEVG